LQVSCTDDFPISNIPMQKIVAKVFAFNEVAKAHRLMESNDACGKIVIKTDI